MCPLSGWNEIKNTLFYTFIKKVQSANKDILLNSSQGRVVQRWVKFNPGLISRNYSRNCFSKEKITVLIKYCSDFLRKKKLVNLKFTDQIHLCKTGKKIVRKIFNLGLSLIGFWTAGPWKIQIRVAEMLSSCFLPYFYPGFEPWDCALG